MGIQLLSQKSNHWREFYNPLRGLTMARIMGLLDAGERGQFADLQWLYHYMERSDPMVFSILQRRRAALLDSDWDIRMVPEVEGGRGEPSPYPSRGGEKVSHGLASPYPSGGADEILAQDQADCLREAYDRLANFRDAVSFLFTGFFRGYAHCEKHRGQDGGVDRLEPVEQWFWVRDGMFGEWEYNENAVSTRMRGQPIHREDFVVLESVALNRMLAILYLRRNLSQKDYDSYLEVFGIPPTFLIGPPNTPDTKEAEYQKIAENIVADGRGYLPNGSDIKYVDGGSAKVPFPDHLAYLDKQITMVGTGGLLTMLAESGSGTLAGNAHQETFLQIARADAAMVSEVFQRDFDAEILAAAFPGYPVLAYFEFAPVESDEAQRVVQDAVALAGAGFEMDVEELSEKTGYKIARPAPAVPAAAEAGAAGAS